MDCTICLDVNICNQKMEYLSCGHSMCKCCFKKLVRNFCPFCRCVIQNKEDGNYDLDINNTLTNDYLEQHTTENEFQIDNLLPQSELEEIDYNDDEYSTYYPMVDEESILKRLNKRKCKKNKNFSSNFRSNKEREPWERKTKKNKKMRRVANNL